MNNNSKTVLEKLASLNKFGGSIVFSIDGYYVQLDKNRRNNEIYFDAVSHNSFNGASKNFNNEFFKLGFEIGEGNYYKMFDSCNNENIVSDVRIIFKDIYKTNYNKEFEITDNIDYPRKLNKTIPDAEIQIKTNDTQVIFLKAFIIGAIVLLTSWLIIQSGKKATGDLKSEACIITQQFVERQLLSPKEAHFGYCDGSQIIQLGHNRYQVTNYVDASNGSGTVIRKTFFVILKYNKGQWENINNWALEKLKIE